MSDEELQKRPGDQMDQDEDTDEQGEGLAGPGVEDEEPGEQSEPTLEEKLKEVVEVQVEDLGGLRRKLTVSIPAETLVQKVNDQYDELRRDALVPGFRKGRAPRRLLEKRFGHEVGQTLVQQLVGSGYLAAVDKAGLKVLGDPLIWVRGEKGGQGQVLVEVKEALDRIEMPAEGPLTFACEVEIRPEFELPELDGIPLEKPVVEVTEDDVTAYIDRLRAYQGVYEPVVDGTIQENDLLTADVVMTCEGQPLKQQEAVQLAARHQVIDGVVLDGLGQALAGKRVGDTVGVSGTIPEDYVKVEFRGKQADFEFRIRGISRRRLPELDDAFLAGLGFDSQDELRAWARGELESSIDEQIRRSLYSQTIRYLLEHTSFELPERLSGRQIDRVVALKLLELYQQGVPEDEVRRLMDDLRTRARDSAVEELKLAFIMEKLAEEIDVDVSDGEINAAIAAIARRQGRRFDRVRDELARQGGLGNLFIRLRDEKLLATVVAGARITEKAVERASGDGGGRSADAT